MSFFSTDYSWKEELQQIVEYVKNQEFDKAETLIESFNQNFLADSKVDPTKPEFIKEHFINPIKNLIDHYIAANNPEAIHKLVNWLHASASGPSAQPMFMERQ